MKRIKKIARNTQEKNDPTSLIKKVFFVSIIFLAAILLVQWVTAPQTSSKPIDDLNLGDQGAVQLNSTRNTP